MEMLYPTTLIPFLRNKHLLLDTNIFRDAASKPTVFDEFFNKLKENDVTLVTIEVVKYELLKGSVSTTKYKEKERLISDIVDAELPITPRTYELVYELIQSCGIDGTALDITDLFLGSMLMQYKQDLCLMTRDTTDFMQKVFNLPFVVNVPHQKGIFTYGIYQYMR